LSKSEEGKSALSRNLMGVLRPAYYLGLNAVSFEAAARRKPRLKMTMLAQAAMTAALLV
jgi:hypothetical protein